MWMDWRRLCSYCPTETNYKIPDLFSLKRLFWAGPKITLCFFACLKLSCCWLLKMKVRLVFLVFSCGICIDIQSVSVSRVAMLLFDNCPPAPGRLNNVLPITPPSVWDFWWKREQHCPLLLHECHFYICWHFLLFVVSQSQVKQPHLLLPFLLLTALPSSPCGRAFPGSAVLQLCGTVSLSVPVTAASSSTPSPACLTPTLPFLILAVSACSEALALQWKEQPEDVCTITATFSQTCPYHSAGENRVPGSCSKAGLRDPSMTFASPSLQPVSHQPFLPPQRWEQASPATVKVCSITWRFAPQLSVTQLGKSGTWTAVGTLSWNGFTASPQWGHVAQRENSQIPQIPQVS